MLERSIWWESWTVLLFWGNWGDSIFWLQSCCLLIKIAYLSSRKRMCWMMRSTKGCWGRSWSQTTIKSMKKFQFSTFKSIFRKIKTLKTLINQYFGQRLRKFFEQSSQSNMRIRLTRGYTKASSETWLFNDLLRTWSLISIRSTATQSTAPACSPGSQASLLTMKMKSRKWMETTKTDQRPSIKHTRWWMRAQNWRKTSRGGSSIEVIFLALKDEPLVY